MPTTKSEAMTEVREWLCENCNTVYPGPPGKGVASSILCPKCGGITAPRLTIENRRLKEKNERLMEQIKAMLGAMAPFARYAEVRKEFIVTSPYLIAQIADRPSIPTATLLAHDWDQIITVYREVDKEISTDQGIHLLRRGRPLCGAKHLPGKLTRVIQEVNCTDCLNLL
jgi:hypothetical protein